TDTFMSSFVQCRASAGECDPAENCPGNGPNCPADAKTSAGTACTDDGNPCSRDECDGSSNDCQHPAGNAGAVCRAAAGCSDVAAPCPCSTLVRSADAFMSSCAQCRASAGECDPAEHCPGTGPSCPADAKTPAGTACTDDGNPCSRDECDGSSNDCQHPAGNAGAVCRAAAGFCDVDDTCTGSSTVCPADARSEERRVGSDCAAEREPAERTTGTTANGP